MIIYLFIAIIIAETQLNLLLSFSSNTSHSCLQKAVNKQFTDWIKEYVKQTKSHIYAYMYLAMQLMNKLWSIIDSNFNFDKAESLNMELNTSTQFTCLCKVII